MSKYIINGKKSLVGEVNISGAKNSAVAIIPAAILLDGPCRIENIPEINDVKQLTNIITQLGGSIEYESNNTILINSQYINSYVAPYEMVKSLRASSYLMGALLGRFNKAEVAFPGGCDFGYRPIDQHIKGFEALGATVEIDQGLLKLSADKLVGSQIYMDVVSVGATINLMLASSKAEGTTTIENAAKEPHVVDVANFLNATGANIKGAGTDIIKIKGVSILSGGITHTIIPDQIEAGTFMIASAATSGDVLIKNIIPKHMESLTAKLIEMNVDVVEGEDWIRVSGNNALHKANIKTLSYPGFPTDLHPLAAVLLCLAEGTSVITEGVWDSRFQYVDELKRMGANIKVDSRISIFEGIDKLSGAPVKATDLRAGAALVIAGLCAEGTTEVYNISYIDRGYEHFDQKLRNLGARIERINE